MDAQREPVYSNVIVCWRIAKDIIVENDATVLGHFPNFGCCSGASEAASADRAISASDEFSVNNVYLALVRNVGRAASEDRLRYPRAPPGEAQ